MKSVFLESHNLKNPYSGFGQFNYHLIKGLSGIADSQFKFIVHGGDPNWVFTELGNSFSHKKYWSFSRFNNFRIRKKFDLWHSLNQNTKIEPFYKIPYILTVHDVNFVEEVSSKANHKRNILFQEKLNRASAITYISDFARKQTNHFFDVPKVPEYKIYNGNPITTLKNTSDFKPFFPLSRPFLYSIGDFVERKNFHTLVEMINLLPEFNLVISGNNKKKYGNKIKDLIDQYELGNRVFLTGKVGELEKQYYLKNCLAFVFPSVREGFGLPPIEAMKFGKPVFLSNSTSLPEIGGNAAYYWNSFDPEQMKKALLDGLHHFEINKKEMKRKCIQRASFFDWEKAANEYYGVYQSVMKN